ncbi:hypothetical protein CALCODRAFT_328948 [Calocera cornea HHB12733]|uniref:Uncharacterized protein n=1 Tax=Calocera cornea HHB12733 TaxID=1353952 RepID=A0A165JIE7_9BASI|nr:hypothetical protein CALCODRAFT_328948 [Calocera cornea HHB12733]
MDRMDRMDRMDSVISSGQRATRPAESDSGWGKPSAYTPRRDRVASGKRRPLTAWNCTARKRRAGGVERRLDLPIDIDIDMAYCTVASSRLQSTFYWDMGQPGGVLDRLVHPSSPVQSSPVQEGRSPRGRVPSAERRVQSAAAPGARSCNSNSNSDASGDSQCSA